MMDRPSHKMDTNVGGCMSPETWPSHNADNDNSQENTNATTFINHAEIAWNEMRSQWLGNSSQRSQRRPREPTMRRTISIEELLQSTEPVPNPIPLAEVVDYLADIWLGEDVYH